MSKVPMRRKPRWKRIAHSPLTWYRSYLTLRRTSGRLASARVAAKLAYVIARDK